MSKVTWKRFAVCLYNLTYEVDELDIEGIEGREESYFLRYAFNRAEESVSEDRIWNWSGNLRGELATQLVIMWGKVKQAPEELDVKHVVRGGYVRLLNRALDDARFHDGPRSIVISGAPGFGKTALASYWGKYVSKHRNATVCSILLFGNNPDESSNPTTPRQALEQLSAHLEGGKPVAIPDNEVAAAIRFRKLAAEHNAVVILDDAADKSHIELLLPTTEQYVAVVTTRSPLTSLEHSFVPIRLEPMNNDESLEVLKKNVPPERRGPDDQLRLIAEYAAGMPLALRNLASRLKRGMQSAQLIRQLEQAGARLKVMSTKDRDKNLQIIFSTSYDQLSDEGRRAYHMLSARLGKGVDWYSVTLVAEKDETNANEIVDSFDSVGLIDYAAGRFEVHDLLRQFGIEKCADANEYRTAVDRLLTGYYGAVNLAFDKANPNNPMVDHHFIDAERWKGRRAADNWISDHAKISTWFAGERLAFVDLTKRACALEPPAPFGPRLASSLFYLLETGNWWDDWEQVTAAGLKALKQQDDPPFHGFLLRNRARITMIKVRDDLDQLRLPEALPPEKAAELRERCERAIAQYDKSIQLLGLPGALPGAKAVAIREVADTRLQLGRIEPTMDNLEATRDAYLAAEELFAGQKNPIASLSLSLGDVYALMGKNHYGDALARYTIALDYALPPLDDRPYTHGALAGHGLTKRAELAVKMEEKTEAVVSWFDKAQEAFRYYDNWRHEARLLVRKYVLLKGVTSRDVVRTDLARAHELLTNNKQVEEADVVAAYQAEAGLA
ncbi:NB-ARC domain-containing protein [Nocardia mexicana]|uniref:NB-ARC domain-containing protein n=2 Tax=Nocardia mexicana TaxID=279262 RepID=A0A370HAP7_9NOCA|nr:NB-ARC domain-containing protein [Nocardia mexicana]